MNPRALKKLDSAAWPATLAMARLASLCLRRPRDPRPLVIRPGGMGDLILMCVAAEELGLDPHAFYWLIERRSRVWAERLGLDYLCYDDGIASRHWEIAGRFTTVINSEQRFGLSQSAAVLARRRGGVLTCFATNRAARFADRRVPYDPDGTHESVMFRRLLTVALDLPCTVPGRVVPRRRSALATAQPVVGLSGLQSESRALSDDQWERFIRSRIGTRAFWIASSEADRAVARRLARRFAGQATVFQGKFAALCELIRRTEQVITVDGGILHIASYYGVPVASLFTSGRDRKWAPLAPGSRSIMRAELACRPCVWFGQAPACAHHFECKEAPL